MSLFQNPVGSIKNDSCLFIGMLRADQAMDAEISIKGKQGGSRAGVLNPAVPELLQKAYDSLKARDAASAQTILEEALKEFPGDRQLQADKRLADQRR
jgi:hypothetical protein